MSENKNIKITPEVNMDDRIFYLVRVNRIEMAFVDTEREARLVVDSIAAAESKRLKDEWTVVFRQDLDDGRKVVISTQALGLMINGAITEVCRVDFIPVGHAVLTRGRLDLTASTVNVGESIIHHTPIPPLNTTESLVDDKSMETSEPNLEENN